MPTRTATRHSPRLAEVLGGSRGILRICSAREAARLVAKRGYKLSDSTIRYLKRGHWGRLETIRIIGETFPGELMRYWGDEIAADIGHPPGPQEAVDWLQWIAQTNGEGEKPTASGRPPAQPAAGSPSHEIAFTPSQWRTFLMGVMQDVNADQRRIGLLMGDWFWRISEAAEQAVQEGRTPPPLPCPPGGWKRLTLVEAEKLLDEYRASCGINTDAPAHRAWTNEGSAE